MQILFLQQSNILEKLSKKYPKYLSPPKKINSIFFISNIILGKFHKNSIIPRFTNVQ